MTESKAFDQKLKILKISETLQSKPMQSFGE